jgi:DNA-binding NarL/FixJ family response regulator
MDKSIIRVLVVDDYAPWREFFCSTLHKQQRLEVIGEASDGLDAVQKAERLQPDLILLDVGLPNLNGIEAARRIREVSPGSKILFVSQNGSWDIVEEVFRIGARGYVIKTDAASGLLPAVRTVLEGRQFISASLAGHDFIGFRDELVPDGVIQKEVKPRIAPETTLKRGSAVTLIATECHRASVLEQLKSGTMDVEALVSQGRYTSVDVIEALGTVVGSNGMPDQARCGKALGDLIANAAAVGTAGHRIAACGEFAPVLLKQGKVEAAIKMEHLTDEFVRNHEMDIFCGYVTSSVCAGESSALLEQIRLEHSAIRGQ